MMNDELLDIVNEKDEVIGQRLRSAIYANKNTNFRVVNAFLINQDGKLWIPRRAANKSIFPLCLDASMGGHVSSGEFYEQALERELMEELRIDLNSCSYECIGKLMPHIHQTSAFMKVYLFPMQKTPDYNPHDFIESFWLLPNELLAYLQNGDKGKDDLSIMLKEFFLN